MDLKRIAKRAVYYLRQGYSLASLPLAFLGWASSIYYLAIKNVPFLTTFFPRFSDFLLVAALTLPILCGLVGYMYMKKTWLFKTSVEVQYEANPYMYKLAQGREMTLQRYQILGAELTLRLFKKLGLITPKEEQEWNEYIEILKCLGEGKDIRFLKSGD